MFQTAITSSKLLGKGLNRKYRITSTNDFQRVRHSGRKYAHPLVVVYIAESKDENSHCGIVTGRSIGNAVNRNLAKRRIRRIYFENLIRFKQHRDIVIIARPSISNAEYSEIARAIEELFLKAGLYS